MNDPTRRERSKLVAERINPDLPLGIHTPKRPGDCGWDLEAMQDMVIKPMHSVDIPVNVRLHLPPGVFATILARSSIAKRNLQVEAGVIDNEYRGPIFVVLRNMQLPTYVVDPSEVQAPWKSTDGSRAAGVYAESGVNDIEIKAGERIGQLVLHKLMPAWLAEGSVDTDTVRGEGGFGSTGTGLEGAKITINMDDRASEPIGAMRRAAAEIEARRQRS